jgi:hypothetical protein
MLAVGREDVSRYRQAYRSERLLRLTVGIAYAVVLAGLVIGSWGVAACFVAAGGLGVALGARLDVSRRWVRQVRTMKVAARARAYRREMVIELLAPHQAELEDLENLVVTIRHRVDSDANPFVDADATDDELVTRLDSVLLLFVDLARELATTRRGLARTAAARPRLARMQDAADPRLVAERRRCRQLGRRRARARHACRQRLDLLECQLASIGELVRLVHEQTLDERTTSEVLSRTVDEVLQEADLAVRARAEVWEAAALEYAA